ncbi:hypothetical protein OPV22_000336 [Ensete ventricosum]|uniref:Uncharacterized protein n=1 Tax=Ensete ventricosum TaxID=4639 RepID=A0AAV8RV97_ENSVE|nr:hypothetical protein OPV22_000336 [Ensete ventricosum]
MAIAGALSPTAMSPGISEDRRQREGCAPPGTAAANMGIVETLRTTAAPAARASATVAPVAVSPTRSADRRQRERCAPTGSAAANTATAEPRRTTAVPAARANAPTHSLDISISIDHKVSSETFHVMQVSRKNPHHGHRKSLHPSQFQ